MRLERALLLVLSPSFTACDASPDENATGSWGLYRRLLDAGAIEFHAPAGPLRARARELALRLEAETPFRGLVPETEREGEPAVPRMVLGTMADERAVRLARPLGLEPLAGGGFRLLGREYRDRGDALLATFEDPERRGVPLILALGNEAEATARLIVGVPACWETRLSVWSAGDLALRVPLDAHGTPLRAQLVDLAMRRDRLFDGSRRVAAGGLDGRGPPGLKNAPRVVARLRQAHARVAAWLAGEPPEIQVFLYAHAEDLAASVGGPEAARVNPVAPRVHLLVQPGVASDPDAGVARATALALAGEPGSAWMLDGIAVAAADAWWGMPLDEWVGHLAPSGLVPPVEELLDPRAGARVEEHVLAPLRGFLFRIVARGRAPDELRRLWADGLDELDPELRRGFELELRRARQDSAARRVERGADRGASLAGPIRFDGMAMVAGSEPGLGYGARAFDASLARAQELGANAFSLTVRATLEPRETVLVSGRARPVHGSTSDVALAAALAAGKRRGMRSLLVVQPLASPSGSWADDVALADGEQCAAVFERCGRIATHYALLAELLEVDILCLAAELSTVAPSLVDDDDPNPDRRRARLVRWTELIERLRRAYLGALTYAARAHREAQRVGFWDQLDFVGIQLFPGFPTADGAPAPGTVRSTLHGGLQRARALGRRWGRPVVIVQTGFPARADAWGRPELPLGAVDPDAQRRFYAGLAEALAGLDGKRWLSGIFLWSWPVDPAVGGEADGGYTPRRKPAEELLPRIFER